MAMLALSQGVSCEQNGRSSTYIGFGLLLSAFVPNHFLEATTCFDVSSNPLQSEGRDGAHSSLTASIDGLNLAEQNSSLAPAKIVFGSAGVLLTTIRVHSLTLQCRPSSSRLSRTRQSTKEAMSSLGYPAPTYARLSTEG